MKSLMTLAVAAAVSAPLFAVDGVWVNTNNSNSATGQLLSGTGRLAWTDAANWADELIPGYREGTPSDEGLADSAAFATDYPYWNPKPGTSIYKAQWYYRMVRLPPGTFTNGVLTGTVRNYLTVSGADFDAPYNREAHYWFRDVSDYLGSFRLDVPGTVSLLGSTTLHRFGVCNRPVVDVPSADHEVTVEKVFGWGKLRTTGAGTVSFAEAGGPDVRLEILGAQKVKVAGRTQPDALDTLPVATDYHFDASDTNKMTLADNGDGTWTVSEWKAETGSVYLTENSFKPTDLPKLRKAGPNGEFVVDFGDWAAKEPASGSASLGFPSDPGRVFTDIFVVYASNDPTQHPPVWGDSRGKDTEHLTGVSSSGFGPYFNETDAGASVRNGRFRLDGSCHDYIDDVPIRGWHLWQVAADGGKLFGQGLCFTKTCGSGGAKIAEVAAYTSALTEDQRRQVAAYLQKKWLRAYNGSYNWDFGVGMVASNATIEVAAGKTASFKSLDSSNASTLTKTGAGVLEAGAVSAPPSGWCTAIGTGPTKPNNAKPFPLVVQEGTFRLLKLDPPAKTTADAVPQDGLLYHFDPTDTSSLTFGEGSETAVTEWKDTRTSSSAVAWYFNAPGYEPKLVKGGINGLDSVDCWNIDNKDEEVGSAFYVSPTGRSDKAPSQQKYREAFVVMDQHAAGGGWGNASPFGGTQSRPLWTTASGRLCGGYYNWTKPTEFSSAAPGAYYALDGVPVLQDVYTMTSNTVVFSLATSSAFAFNALAIGAASGFVGGINFGEVLVYDRRLLPEERRNVEAYLLKRWKNMAHPTDLPRRLGATTVADGCGLELAGEARLRVEGDLTLGANATLGLGQAGEDESEVPLEVTGALSIADGTTIRIGAATLSEEGAGRLVLAKAASISADASKLNVELPASVKPGRLKVVGNRLLYAGKRGLVILLR